MGKTLLLMAIDKDQHSASVEHMNKIVTVAPIYAKVNHLFIRAIRRAWCDLKLPGFTIWFDSWWKNIDQYDTVIAVAYKNTYRLFSILKKRKPKIRRILYWWDPIEKVIHPDVVDPSICEKWTFNKRDAKQYDIHYNATYLSHPMQRQDHADIDVMFVGTGGSVGAYARRVEELRRFWEACEAMGISTSFHVYYKEQVKDSLFPIDRLIREEEYYHLVAQARALLDLVDPEAPWMTLRPLEALYAHKKLISNNRDLLDEPLYHPDNVFILGVDQMDDLPQFLASPCVELDAEVYDYYTFESWLKRFDLKEEQL